VEFALVVPLLVMLLFGIIAFGIVFAQKLALGNAARQAARYGVVDGRTCAQIETSARDAANTIGMSGTDVTVIVTRSGAVTSPCNLPGDWPCAGSATNDELKVTVRFKSALVIPPVASPEVTIEGDGVFRCEWS